MEPRVPDAAAGAAVRGGRRQRTAFGKWSVRPMQKTLRKEKPVTSKQHHASDLRSTLEWLRAQGDLIETDKPVDPDLEVTGLQKHIDGGCPVLFNKVKGKPNHQVLTNLFGDIKVINKMFGWKDDAERVRKLAYALSHPLKPVEIPQQQAPCQEHVIERPKDVNEHMVAIRHTTYEPELTVGSGRSRRAPSTPWPSPTASWCWKATSIRATADSRPRNPRIPASRAASTSI